MRIKRLLIFFLFSILPNFVFSQTVDVEYDPRIHFPYLKTFSWRQKPTAARPEVHKMIIAEIEKQLISKGFKKDDKKPDFLVTYYGSTETQVKTDEGGYSVGDWGNEKKRHEPVKVGTLVVDLIGSVKNGLIWRGTAQDTVSNDLAKVQETVRRAVEKLFADFPPGKK
ncbi:DUF4136 domain-containing protein [bacterium]|nr:DUF4136 domain-containing protein [bacterium]